MVSRTEHLFLHSKAVKPVLAVVLPIRKPFQIGIRLTEKLQFHLFELSCTESKVSRCNLISERLSNLRNTEGQFLSRRSLHILKVHKNALCGFRTKINGVLRIFRHTLEGFKHQIELSNRCEIMLSARRTGDIFLCDKFLHIGIGPGIHRTLKRNAVFRTELLYQLICTKTLMAFFTIHQRIRKTGKMTGGNPSLRIHQNRTIDSHIILGLLHKLLPPGLLDIVLQFHAQIPIVPGIRQPAINLRTGIYKSSRLCQGNNRVHRIILCHISPLLLP